MESKKKSITVASQRNDSSGEIYKSLIDSSGSAIFLTKSTGEIIEVNSAAEKMFGYSKEEFLKLCRQEIIEHAESNFDVLLAQRIEIDKARGELTGIKKNRERFPAEFTSSLFIDNSGEEFNCTIMQDITFRKIIEQEMLLMLNNTEESFVLLDKELLILNFNKQFKNLYKWYFNLSIEKGLSILNFVKSERLAEAKKIYKNVLKGEVIFKLLNIKDEEDEYGYFKIKYAPSKNEANDIIGIFITIRDITNETKSHIEIEKKQKKLEQTEVNYRALFEKAFEGIFIHELQTGKILDANQKACEMFGLSRNEILNASLTRFADGSAGYSVKDLKEKLKEASEGKPQLFEWISQHSGGKLNWVEVSLQKATIAGTERILAYFRPIKDRKNTEHQTQLQRQDKDALINSTDDLIWSVGKDLKLIAANNAFQAMMKMLTDQNLQEGDDVLMSRFGKELIAKWKQYYARAFKGEKFSVNEQFYNPYTNTTVYELISFNPILNNNNEVVGVACYAKNVTKLTENQMAIEATKYELDNIMASSQDIICVISKDNSIERISAASEIILGYKPTELVGKNLFDFIYYEDAENAKKTALEVMAGKTKTHVYNRYVRKDGSLVYLEWTAKWDEQSKKRYGVARDVSAKVEAENKLKSSEQRFKSLVQDASDMIVILNEDATYKYVSPACFSIIGFEPHEFIEKNVLDFIHPDDVQLVENYFALLQIVKKITLPHFRFRHKNGEWRWMETSLTNLIDEEAVNGIVANLRDITERKNIEKDLIETKENYKSLFENGPAPMYIFDFETLQIIDCNEEALLKYGYTKEEFLQLNIKDIDLEDDITKAKKVIEPENACGEIHKKIWRHKKKNGEIMYMDITEHLIDYNGKKVSIVMLKDVTEKLKQEEQSELEKIGREAAIQILKDKDFKLENAQKIAKLGYWQLDVKSNLFYWSKQIYRIWGVSEMVQPDLNFFISTIHPSDVDVFLAAKNNALINDKELNEEHRIIAANGAIKWIHEKARLIKNESGEVIFLTGTAQDITQRKKAEEELKKTNRHLKNAQRIVHMGNWEYDAVTDKLFWSDEVYNIFGKEHIENEQLYFADFIKQIHPDDFKLIQQAKVNTEVNAVPIDIEYRIIMHDGREKTVHEQGEISYNEDLKRFLLIGTVQDITERKNAEREIYESNQRYEHVSKATYDAIWEWDIVNNKTYRAEGFERSFGFNLKEINNAETEWENFIHLDDRENAITSIQSALKSNEDYWSHEYRLIKPNGEHAYVEDRAFILRNLNGEAQRVIGALRDITERKYYHDLEILEREVLKKNTQGEKSIEEIIGAYILGIEKLHPGMIGSIQKLKNNRLYNLSSPNLPESYLKAIDAVEVGDDMGSCDTAAYLKQNIIVADIATDIRWPKYKDTAAEAGLKACWSYPVFDSKNNVVATLAIYYKIIKTPTAQEANTIKGAVNILQTILESYQRESALQESNQRYLNVTRATFDAIWDWDIMTNHVYWGDTHTELFGHFEDDNLSDNEKVHARLHPDERENIIANAKAAIKGNDLNWTLEHRYLKEDKTYAYVLNKALIVRDEDGYAVRVIGAMQDITRQKEEEQRLKLMSSVVTNTNDAILITDVKTSDKPGQSIIYANEAFCKMTGYTAAEVIGKTPRILQGPKTDRIELDKIAQALRKWESCETTIINYKKNGEEFWINFTLTPVANEKGSYTHWISIERDVTDRKNDELQKELLRKIRIIFNEPNTINETLDKVLKDVTLYGDFCFAESWLLTADKKEIKRATYYVADSSMRYTLNETSKINIQKKGEGLVGTAWKTLELQMWELAKDYEKILEPEVLLNTGVNKLYGLPFLNNSEIIGVLVFGLDKPETSGIKLENLFNSLKIYLGAEIKRKQLEQELTQLFDFAPDIIVILGSDGYFKKINPAASNLLEYSSEELMAVPFINFIHPDDKNKTIEKFNEIKGGILTLYFENRYITKLGKIKWLAWTTSPLMGDEIIFAVAKNITEKKDLEVVLDKANKLARIGSWELDIEKNTLYWSEMTKELHEVPPGFIPTIEKDIAAYKEGRNREEMIKRVEEAMEKGTAWDVEKEIITENGNERWVRSIGKAEFKNGKCVKVYGSLQDINPRKRAEESIRSSEERRELIMNAALDAIICIDKNGKVTFWNPQAELIFGWTENEALDKLLANLIIPEQYKLGKQNGMKYYLKTGIKKTLNILSQFSAIRKNGEEFPIELTVLPIEQEGKKFFCAFIRDITERKLSETRLLELNHSLQKQTRELEGINKELEQFAYVASHDLQEPLRMVTNFITQLEKKYGHLLDEKGKKYIFFAVDGARRMRQIILDLLEYSRIGRIDELKESIDLNEIVEEIKILYSGKIKEQKAIITTNNLPVVTSYKSPIRQVFQNLISNALKYCKENNPCRINISATAGVTHWQFSITDNGIGINKDYFEKIFVIFQRLHTKEVYSGSGMGLAVTKKIIENLNGKIWVESAEGKGSVFYFTIPNW